MSIRGTPVEAGFDVDFDAIRREAERRAAEALNAPRKGGIRSVLSAAYNHKFALAIIATSLFLASPCGAEYLSVITSYADKSFSMLTGLFWNVIETINPPPPPPPPSSWWWPFN